MNTQNDTTIVNPMQVTEAFPLEDRSLPANEVLTEQQSEFADSSDTVPVFVP
jgi:hypothetical protein